MVHVVIGAGPVGTTVATQLAEAGRPVRVLTRSGSGPEHPLVERRRVDASDPVALKEATADAVAVFDCMHASRYELATWRRELPVTEQAVLEAAGAHGAVVVFPESLYSYTRTNRPMTEDDPRDRATGKGAVRRDLLTARAASTTPTVSVVASDFIGPHVTAGGHMAERAMRPVLEGGSLKVVASLDEPHSWTYVPDLAAAMIVAADRPDLWDRVLHAPTGAPHTQREVVTAYAAEAGRPVPRLGAYPVWMMRALGAVHTDTRELAEMAYQFAEPFVLDSSRSEAELGLSPTPWDEVVRETVRWWRERLGA